MSEFARELCRSLPYDSRIISPFSALEVRFNSHLRTHDLFRFANCYWAHSRTALAFLLNGVRWHDTSHTCPTWTWEAECRCDVEPL